MQAIKNFDENVYIVQDENGKYYIKINGKTMTKQEDFKKEFENGYVYNNK
jgi:hypothetical protein